MENHRLIVARQDHHLRVGLEIEGIRRDIERTGTCLRLLQGAPPLLTLDQLELVGVQARVLALRLGRDTRAAALERGVRRLLYVPD